MQGELPFGDIAKPVAEYGDILIRKVSRHTQPFVS
jgi:hypothetical protein